MSLLFIHHLHFCFSTCFFLFHLPVNSKFGFHVLLASSCTFTDHILELNKDNNSLTEDKFLVICETLAIKMLSNANLSIVSVDMPVASNLDDASGLCLRFCSEILSNSMPCLITITVEGKCSDPLTASVKVNCEDTVFGLNFLNRVVNFLVEPYVALS